MGEGGWHPGLRRARPHHAGGTVFSHRTRVLLLADLRACRPRAPRADQARPLCAPGGLEVGPPRLLNPIRFESSS